MYSELHRQDGRQEEINPAPVLPIQYHTGPSFNTSTEDTIQVSKFKRIGFEKMVDFDGGEYL